MSRFALPLALRSLAVRCLALRCLALLSLIVAPVTCAIAQQGSTYPARQITLHCPFATGSITDIEARVLATALTSELKQSVIVVNSPGASSAIGANKLQQLPSDGYNLFIDVTSYLAYLTAARKIEYSSDDFVGIAALSNEAIALVGRGDDQRFASLVELLAYAKSHPNALSIGGTGAEAIEKQVFEDLQTMTGTTATYVPYNGGGPQISALLGGHIDAGLTAPSNVVGQLESNKLRIFAVAAQSDIYAPLPNVPTFKRAGYSLSANVLRALYVKKGTTPEIISRLEAAVQRVLASPDWAAFEKRYVQEHVVMSPAQLQAHMKSLTAEWERTLASSTPTK